MTQKAFVGTYTDGESEGVYTLEIALDETVSVDRTGATAVPDNPSFLAVHPDEETLYAVHEVSEGGASAFSIDGGDLDHLGRVESGAGGPCHCSVHPSGEYLFVAHYTGAAVSALPIEADGSLAAPSDVVHHEGSSLDPDRQDQAHPHSITPGPNGRFVYVPDLGKDEVVVYDFDTDAGAFERVDAVGVAPGAGPRHLDFHPDEPFVYLINELDSTITTFGWEAESGELTEIASVSTLPEGYDGENVTADIHVHPSGEYLYGSNRGHDSIAAFDLTDALGAPSPIDHYSTRGEWPRHFTLDATGTVLFAENKRTDDIVPFHVDEETGELDATGDAVSVPSPVCMWCLQIGE